MASELRVGDKVRLLADIWDDGQDHHPPGYLAHRGEVLFVRAVDQGHEFPICVSHKGRTDNSFRVALNEVEKVADAK
jgi:hypothetical protein